MNLRKIISFIIVFCVFSWSVTVNAVANSAKAAVLINADTGEVLYSKNSDERLPMASTTKIMTALLLCEYGISEKEITVTKEMVSVEGTSMGLLAGDKVTVHDLLYGMMLSSGNDAANTSAFVVGGNIKNFVGLMNKKADALGLKNTHFATPSGLDGTDHYTTAYELALIAAEAMKSDDFRKAVGSKSAVLYYGNPPYRRSLSNHNKLLKMYDDVIGVKTGFTKKAGRCLVSAAKKDGKYLIAVTLCDPDDWNDHRALLNLGYSLLNQKTFSANSKSDYISVINGEKSRVKVKLPSVTVFAGENENASQKTVMSNFLYAPVKKGDKVGETAFYFNDRLYKTCDITACENIEKKEKKGFERFKDIFFSILMSV